MSFEIEETLFLELPDGKNIPVKNLDERIQQQVKVYDKLRADVTEKHYELQVYQSALQIKKQIIENLMNSVYAKKDESADNSPKAPAEGESEKKPTKRKKTTSKSSTAK